MEENEKCNVKYTSFGSLLEKLLFQKNMNSCGIVTPQSAWT